MKRYLYEKGGLLFIYETRFKKVRVLNLKTGTATETENSNMIEKIIKFGEETIAPTEKEEIL
jgi:hypothetical protein